MKSQSSTTPLLGARSVIECLRKEQFEKAFEHLRQLPSGQEKRISAHTLVSHLHHAAHSTGSKMTVARANKIIVATIQHLWDIHEICVTAGLIEFIIDEKSKRAKVYQSRDFFREKFLFVFRCLIEHQSSVLDPSIYH